MRSVRLNILPWCEVVSMSSKEWQNKNHCFNSSITLFLECLVLETEKYYKYLAQKTSNMNLGVWRTRQLRSDCFYSPSPVEAFSWSVIVFKDMSSFWHHIITTNATNELSYCFFFISYTKHTVSFLLIRG